MLPVQVSRPPDWLPFKDALGNAVARFPDIAVQVGMVVAVALLVAGTAAFVAAPLVRLLAGRLGAHDRLQQFLSNLTTVLLVVLGLLVGLLLGGFELASAGLVVLLLLGALGTMLAADDLVRDVVGGVLLLVSQPFGRGDWIAVGDVEGRVERVGLRVTNVRTFDNETVTVPNATLNEQPVTNRSAQNDLRQTFRFGVAYEQELSTAMEAVHVAAREVEGVADEPLPEVRAVDLDPSWVTLRATVWLDDPTRLEYIDTRSAFIRAVRAALMENDIDINPKKTELSGQIGTVELDADGTGTERGVSN